MKIAQLLNSDFQEALRTIGQASLPMPIAYKLKKLVNKINEELVTYNELLEKARKDATGEDNSVDQAKFIKSYQELVNIEVKVPQLPISAFQHVKLSAKDLMFLEPILLEDLEEATADKDSSSQGPATT